jgi:hypothetical protein
MIGFSQPALVLTIILPALDTKVWPMGRIIFQAQVSWYWLAGIIRLVHGIILYSLQGWAQLIDSQNIVSL